MRNTKFAISNVGLVSHISLRLDGISVITGYNNTGKSSVGKTVYSFLQPSIRLDTEFERNKQQLISDAFDICKMKLRNVHIPSLSSLPVTNSLLNGNGFEATLDNVNSMAEEMSRAETKIKVISKTGSWEWKNSDKTKQRVCDILDVVKGFPTDEVTYYCNVCKQLLNREFSHQIGPLRKPDACPSVSVSIGEGKIVSYDGSASNTIISSPAIETIASSCFLIDDANVIDSLCNKQHLNSFEFDVRHRRHLCDSLLDRINVGEEIPDSIARFFHAVELGNSSISDDGAFMTMPYGKVSLATIATGAKLFTIIKMLLENGSLKRDGLLILDEPEAHLHPSWINVLACLIVALHKELKITTLMTTQSEYMVYAIDSAIQEAGVCDVSAFYHPMEQEDGMCVFSEVETWRVLDELQGGFRKAFDKLMLKRGNVDEEEEQDEE